MATEILKSFSHLQSELDEAKSSLKGVDENIKRLIGRDPSDLPPRPGVKRPLDDKNSRQVFSKVGRFVHDDNSNNKRRNPNAVSVFKRLSEKVSDDHIKTPSKGLISKVIAAPKEVPSRQSVLDKQNKDEKFKARNRRMFGALLGTLQRFQQEETKLKKREEKRTQIEKKIDEHEQQEKEEIKRERQELFLNRKKKQQEIKMIELKMLRMKEYAAWEQSQKPRTNFIVTKAKPHINFLPRKIDDKSKELLEKSKIQVEEQIEERRKAVLEELSHIEERMKRNFESKNNLEVKEEEKSATKHDRGGSDSELDDDVDHKMRSPSPELKEVEQEKEIAPKEPDLVKTEHNNSKPNEEGLELQASDGENGPQSSVEQSENSTTNDIYDHMDNNLKTENNTDSSNVDRNIADISTESSVSNINVIVSNGQKSTQDVQPETI